MTDSQRPIDPDPDDPLLTPREVAAWLHISHRTLERWRKDPDHPLEWGRSGGQIRYAQSAVQRYIRLTRDQRHS